MEILWAVLGLGVGALAAAVWARLRRRRLERELEETRRRLEAARAARKTFFDLTTHELRSPLAAILGFQELLRDDAYGRLNPEARDAVVRIGHSARHLLNLLDGVMELSRLRTGTVQPDLGAVDTGILLAAAAEAFRSLAVERGITPEVRLPEQAPTIESDQDRLARAFDLLLTSAVRHPAGDTLRLTVDTDAERITVALEPTHLEVDPDDEPETAGIRLAVAAGIAELLGGGLDLAIEDDRVRRITFHIPTSPAPPGL